MAANLPSLKYYGSLMGFTFIVFSCQLFFVISWRASYVSLQLSTKNKLPIKKAITAIPPAWQKLTIK